MRTLITSWLDSGRTRRHDAYLRRGRCYAALSDELLLRSLSIARQCGHVSPGDAHFLHEQDDLISEMELRGLRISAAAAYGGGWSLSFSTTLGSAPESD